MFGGRAAEEVFLNQKTTGASNDFERATQLARDMVTRYGMSDAMGVMVYAENEGEVFLGRSITRTTHVSEATMQKIDAEIRRILEEQYKRACDLLREHSDKVELMVKCLMKWETIDEDQIADIMNGREVRPPRIGSSAKNNDHKPIEPGSVAEKPAQEERVTEEKAAPSAPQEKAPGSDEPDRGKE